MCKGPKRSDEMVPEEIVDDLFESNSRKIKF